MFRNLILKYRVKEPADKDIDIVIDALIQKIIADASLGTDYVMTAHGQEFYAHEKQDDVIEAKVLTRTRIDDKNTELIFSVPIFFENKEDFFAMFMTCTGEPPGFHSNIFLDDFYIEGDDPFKDSLSKGPEKYKKYFGREGPFLGTIIKPNLGTDMIKRVELIKKLMMNGVDFLKDDEVFGVESFDVFKSYVTEVNKVKEEVYSRTGHKTLVCFNITSLASKADQIYELPIEGIMINFLALGLSKSYELVHKFKEKCIIHGHRVGSAVFLSTSHKNVLIKLACMIGLDSTHLGTPLIDDIEKETKTLKKDYVSCILSTFTKVNPQYVEPLTKYFSKDILFLPCGGVYRHPEGFEKGIKAFKTAIDMYNKEKSIFYDKDAYDKSLMKWGY
jgi:hypothetical protein